MREVNKEFFPDYVGEDDLERWQKSLDHDLVIKHEVVVVLKELGISAGSLPFEREGTIDLIVSTALERLQNTDYDLSDDDIRRVLLDLGDEDSDEGNSSGGGGVREPRNQPPSSSEGDAVADESIDTAGIY